MLEIERLKRKNGPSTKKGKIPSKLDAFIRGIEEEREYYRQQADALQRMLRGEPPRSSSPIRSRPSSRSGSPVRERPDKKVCSLLKSSRSSGYTWNVLISLHNLVSPIVVYCTFLHCHHFVSHICATLLSIYRPAYACAGAHTLFLIHVLE